MKFGLGQPVARREDDRLLRGLGRYVSDVSLPERLQAAVLRSPVAHGRITALDVSEARKMPGVHLILTHQEIADRLLPLGNEFPFEPAPAPVTVPHLSDGPVRFVGQPIAFVVAENRARAQDACEAILLEIDELAPVTDPVAALAPGAPQLHEAAPGNLAYEWTHGDAAEVEAIFARAAHVVETPVTNQRVVIASMEPRAIAIRYDRETERWEGWVGCQGAHGMRGRIAHSLGVAPERLRIHVPDVGGAFGMKLMTHPEYALAALAAQDLGRPVVWLGDRSESFLSDAQGRDMRGTVRGAFDAEGKLLAAAMDTVSGIGAQYSSVSVAIHTVFSAVLLGGMYDIAKIHCRARGAFLNTPPMDAYRGAGRPETNHATERLMDAAAAALGIDRIEIRRRNLLRADQVPHATPGGFTYDSLDCQRLLERALALADVPGFAARRAEAEGRGRLRGLGVAYYMERTGGGPVEETQVSLGTDGRATIRIGTQSSGQGHATAWAQVLCHALGLDYEAIDLAEGDSDALPAGGGTGGSRSAKMASRVILLAAEEIERQGRAAASARLEAAEADIVFSPEDGGRFSIAGTDRSVGLPELAAEAGGFEGRGRVDGRESTFPNGCHIAEVEIDRETGGMDLVGYWVVDDFGTLINPELVAGQVHGGIAQGVGQVLGEDFALDPETGQPLAGSFMDYWMPRAADLPAIGLEFVEVPAKTNPLGLKGCGEAGCCGAIPATALAVEDALRGAGASEMEPPYTPLRIWQVLQGVGVNR